MNLDLACISDRIQPITVSGGSYLILLSTLPTSIPHNPGTLGPAAKPSSRLRTGGDLPGEGPTAPFPRSPGFLPPNCHAAPGTRLPASARSEMRASPHAGDEDGHDFMFSDIGETAGDRDGTRAEKRN